MELADFYGSIHDLSRVQLEAAASRVPRFNMPFELGLAVLITAQATALAEDHW